MIVMTFNNLKMSFTNRTQILKTLADDYIKTVRTDICETQEELDVCYSDYMENGYEGQMVRNNTPYENKRSKNLLKRKEFKSEEYKVVEMLEGSGNWAGYAKRFMLELPDGRKFGSGIRGQQAQLKALWEFKDVLLIGLLVDFLITLQMVFQISVIVDYGKGQRED